MAIGLTLLTYVFIFSDFFWLFLADPQSDWAEIWWASTSDVRDSFWIGRAIRKMQCDGEKLKDRSTLKSVIRQNATKIENSEDNM